jgi:hypothetical protein
MKPRHKYNAKPVEQNGRRYASKAEARYAQGLEWRKRAGEVVGWLEQIPLHLPGGVVYRLDFLVFESDGTVRAVEVKGFETPQWKIKKRLAEEAYPWLPLEIVK